MKSSISSIALTVVLLLTVVLGTLPIAAATKTTSSKTAVTSSKKLPPQAPSAQMHFCANDLYQAASCDPINNAFDINTVRDVTVFVSWQNVSGAHVQKLIFLMPNGDPYQAMSTAFDTTTGQSVQLLGGLPTVSNVLPIAGTWIQQRAITGTWTVQVYLDDVYVGQAPLNLY